MVFHNTATVDDFSICDEPVTYKQCTLLHICHTVHAGLGLNPHDTEQNTFSKLKAVAGAEVCSKCPSTAGGSVTLAFPFAPETAVHFRGEAAY